MVANSEMNYKFKTIMEVIKALVLDFVLYFVTEWQTILYM